MDFVTNFNRNAVLYEKLNHYFGLCFGVSVLAITDLGTFSANGEVLEGNRFSTTVSSLRPVQVTAEISGIQVGEAVSIMASDRYAFTPRALLEEITRTSCVNCPTMIRVIEHLSADEPQTVIAYYVHNAEGASEVYHSYYTDISREYADAFCTFIGSDLTGGGIRLQLRRWRQLRSETLNRSRRQDKAGWQSFLKPFRRFQGICRPLRFL